MKIGFLIITYGDTYLQNCINSIHKFYPDMPIYIVDNKQVHQKYINNSNNSNNINYTKNDINNYELGAIWFALKQWKDVNKFIILHNSMELINKLPECVFIDEYVPFWTARAIDYSPTVSLVENMLSTINLKLNNNNNWESVCGCCCSINTNILTIMKEMNCDKLFATNKIEAVATEILFGYLIHNVLNIKYKNKLHEFPLYEYISIPGKVKRVYTIIKKVGSGQGYNLNKTLLIPMNISNKIFEIYNPLLSNNTNLINILQQVENNKVLETFLLTSLFYNLHVNNNRLSNILHSIRHRMFTKKYFYNDYLIEYNDIITKKKLIFSD